MGKTQKQTQLCKRLSACGIKQEHVYNIITDFQKWESCSGSQWTVSRLKDLKVSFIQLLASGSLEDHSWPSWVALNKSGFPKGSLGVIMQKAFEENSPRTIQRAISALMVYSSVLSNNITEKQWGKFQQSAEKEYPPILLLKNWFSSDGCHGDRNLSLSYDLSKWSIANKNEPTSLGLLSGDGKTQKEEYGELVLGFQSDLVQEYFKEELEHKVTKETLFAPRPEISGPKLDMMTKIYLSSHGESLVSTKMSFPVGKIGFIQEPGLKLRSVANPHRIYQFLLDPLKEDLLSILHKLPSDCTMNQDSGVEWSQHKLGLNERLSSVDLSDATNNFPLLLQTNMLRNIYSEKVNPIIDLFTKVSQANWLVRDPIEDKVRNFKWTTGQPLGLGPSFPAFALAHHLVMWEVIGKKLGDPFKAREDFYNYIKNPNTYKGFDYTDEYRILGDDIVMKSKYEEIYVQTLTNLDMGVSKDKTLTSNRWAEFASRLINKDMIIIQNKWKLTSDRNFLDLMRNLGPTAVGLLRPKQAKMAKLIAQVPDVLETGLGFRGLGWNPKGYSMSLRYAAFKEFLDKTRTETHTELFLTKEVSALEISKRLYGDEFVYSSGIYGITSDIQQHKAETAKGDSPSVHVIDKIYKIPSHQLNVDEIYSEDLIKPSFTQERKSGDMRGASILDTFDKKGLIDVLKTDNRLLGKIDEFSKEKPEILDAFKTTFEKGELTSVAVKKTLYDYQFNTWSRQNDEKPDVGEIITFTPKVKADTTLEEDVDYDYGMIDR